MAHDWHFSAWVCSYPAWPFCAKTIIMIFSAAGPQQHRFRRRGRPFNTGASEEGDLRTATTRGGERCRNRGWSTKKMVTNGLFWKMGISILRMCFFHSYVRKLIKRILPLIIHVILKNGRFAREKCRFYHGKRNLTMKQSWKTTGFNHEKWEVWARKVRMQSGLWIARLVLGFNS